MTLTAEMDQMVSLMNVVKVSTTTRLREEMMDISRFCPAPHPYLNALHPYFGLTQTT